jgi:AraC-like DNA-binding protein
MSGQSPSDLARELGMNASTLTRRAAAVGNGGLLTVKGRGYRVWNVSGKAGGRNARWEIEPDARADSGNLTRGGKVDGRRTVSGSLDEMAKKAKIQKLLTEIQLGEQRLLARDRAQRAEWCACLSRALAEASALWVARCRKLRLDAGKARAVTEAAQSFLGNLESALTRELEAWDLADQARTRGR